MRAVYAQVSFKTTASISDSANSYAMASSPVAGLPAAPPVLAREISAPARLICDMGFPVAWAEFALVAVGGEDVTAAIDYCLANADKMEELIATPAALCPNGQPLLPQNGKPSHYSGGWVCDGCGKAIPDAAFAFHAAASSYDLCQACGARRGLMAPLCVAAQSGSSRPASSAPPSSSSSFSSSSATSTSRSHASSTLHTPAIWSYITQPIHV